MVENNKVRLIDANALKEVIFSKTNGMEDLWDTAGVLNAINNAPTVDLKDIYQEGYYDGHLEGYTKAINEERPQGEWIFVAENELARSMDDEKLTTYKCPLCERMLITFPSKLTDYPFCHCGADMRGGGTNE